MSLELGWFALLVLVVSCIAAGVTGALVHTWTIKANLYSLDSRLSVVEGNLTREVKARAGQERWKKPDKDEQLLAAMVGNGGGRKKNWWEVTPAK